MMRAALFVVGLALATGADAHPTLGALVLQGAAGVALIWTALHWRKA
jgi:hypothetical protein